MPSDAPILSIIHFTYTPSKTESLGTMVQTWPIRRPTIAKTEHCDITPPTLRRTVLLKTSAIRQTTSSIKRGATTCKPPPQVLSTPICFRSRPSYTKKQLVEYPMRWVKLLQRLSSRPQKNAKLSQPSPTAGAVLAAAMVVVATVVAASPMAAAHRLSTGAIKLTVVRAISPMGPPGTRRSSVSFV